MRRYSKNPYFEPQQEDVPKYHILGAPLFRVSLLRENSCATKEMPNIYLGALCDENRFLGGCLQKGCDIARDGDFTLPL